jgi:hypothetical protein
MTATGCTAGSAVSPTCWPRSVSPGPGPGKRRAWRTRSPSGSSGEFPPRRTAPTSTGSSVASAHSRRSGFRDSVRCGPAPGARRTRRLAADRPRATALPPRHPHQRLHPRHGRRPARRVVGPADGRGHGRRVGRAGRGGAHGRGGVRAHRCRLAFACRGASAPNPRR